MDALFGHYPQSPYYNGPKRTNEERNPRLHKMSLEIYQNINHPKPCEIYEDELYILDRIKVSGPFKNCLYDVEILNSAPPFRMNGLEYESVLDIAYAYANSLIS